MSKTKYEVLSDKQKKVWALREQGKTVKETAQVLGVSENAIRQTLKRIERRFSEYDRYMAEEEKNKTTIFFPLTRGEGKLIIRALRLLDRELDKTVVHNVKSDWYGRLPFESIVVEDLLSMAEIAVYGRSLSVKRFDPK